MKKPVLSLLLLAASVPAMSGDLEVTGSLGAEVRTFVERGALPGQLETWQPSLLLEGDIRWLSDNRQWDLVMVPYARLDAKDDGRSHFDMREAYVRWTGETWSVRAGLGKVFWGVTESRHLVDIINQSDTVEDIDNEDKLGQPMIEVAASRDWGQLTGYIMPRFRERSFAGSDGRLRPPLPVDDSRAQFDSGQDDDGDVDLALRYSHYFGDWDVGLSLFHGVDREPRLVLDAGSGVLVPFYDDISQVGLDLQYTRDAWLWKFESIVRHTPFETFAAVVGGFEYTFYGVTGEGADLGVLMELQYDGRTADPLLAPITIADNDLFVGTRLALNDTADTDFLGGVVADLEDGSMSGLIEASTRIGDTWVAEVEGRFFINVDPTNPLAGFKEDSHLILRLTRYF